MTDLNSTEQAEFADFPPALTMEEVERLEESAKTQARGQPRRCVLLACSASSDKLRELRDEAPEAFLEMLEAIQVFNVSARPTHL